MTSRTYCFTWNNPVHDTESYVLALPSKYVLFGREVAETGTPHLQGVIVFRSQVSKSTAIRRLKGAHVSVCRDFAASVEYCKKDDNFVEQGSHADRSSNCLSINEKRAQRNKVLMSKDLKTLVSEGFIAFSQVAVLQKCKNILLALNEPYSHSDVRGQWYAGPPGTGKSRQARELYPDAYIKAQNKWWDGYQSHHAVILDDLDFEGLGHNIKIWTDRYSCSGETKGGHVQLVHRVFVITSNYLPEELFKDSVMASAVRRRCHVTNFRIL